MARQPPRSRQHHCRLPVSPALPHKPAIGDQQIRTVRREDIKEIIAGMSRKGLSASRVNATHLVIRAVFTEAVRNKKLADSPCTDIPLPDVATAADFILPDDDELDALAAGLPADWAATVWLMHGCGLRIGEALAVRTSCRINRGTTLRVREQINPTAQLRPVKFRAAGQFRDIPCPCTSPRRSTSTSPPTAPRPTGTSSRGAGTST
jgi:integrase